MSTKLAIDGGTPVRPEPLRGGFHGSAEIDQQEIDAVLDNIRSIYNPFLTFYKAETEKIKERNEKLSGCKTGLLALKSEIEALSEPGLKKEE